MNPVTKRNFAVFPVLDWIAALTVHIPNKGEQLTRYYGYYSNVSRGKRKKEKPKEETEIGWKPEVIEIEAPPVSKELKKRWFFYTAKDQLFRSTAFFFILQHFDGECLNLMSPGRTSVREAELIDYDLHDTFPLPYTLEWR